MASRFVILHSNRAMSCLRSFATARSASFALNLALCFVPLAAAAGLAMDYSNALRERSQLQALLDAAVLAGAANGSDPIGAASSFFSQTVAADASLGPPAELASRASFQLAGDTLNGQVSRPYRLLFGLAFPAQQFDIGVTSQVIVRKTPQGPCITVLADTSQALLLNSGANVNAKTCQVDVHSTKDPAFIMNAGVTMNVSKLCVKGTKYIRNGGTLSKLETACTVTADPYAGKIPEPGLPSNCTSSGAHDGQTQTLNPGMHCWVNFNGSPKITFKPGLHIIRGPMIINSGATVVAEGVTFYFPDTDSMIQANGGLKMTASAPATGAYKNILMFEKTSDAANNAKKRQYVFNGSNGESLNGVIYLPNRDVTYNSKTNINSSGIAMVVNTMIINSANWTFQALTGQSSQTAGFYLSK